MDPKTNGTQEANKDGASKDGVQGEGNYDATHNYDAAVAASVAKGKSEELAKKAKTALEGTEGDELRKAEKEGKKGEPKVTSK